MFYSFSFLTDLEQEWPLTERYPGQPDILRYLEEVTDRLDLRKDFTFGAEVTAVEFDEAAGLWTLRTAQGHQAIARYVVTAVGCLSTANQPRFPGSDTFGGLSLHTGNWPREPVDLAGKRVAVVGTGASGIQAIRCRWVSDCAHRAGTPSRGCSAAVRLRPFRASAPPAGRGPVLRSARRLTAALTGPTALSPVAGGS
jgi:cation diffusion facilitator CzcD-associated flavoprotein CzcO